MSVGANEIDNCKASIAQVKIIAEHTPTKSNYNSVTSEGTVHDSILNPYRVGFSLSKQLPSRLAF